MNEEKFVTMNVRESTKKRFNEHGIKGQTDDQLLNVLIDNSDLYQKVKKK